VIGVGYCIHTPYHNTLPQSQGMCIRKHSQGVMFFVWLSARFSALSAIYLA